MFKPLFTSSAARALVPVAAAAALLAGCATGPSVSPTAAAAAGPVYLAPVTLEPSFEADLADQYGEREVGVLQQELAEALSRELTASGFTLQSDAGGATMVSATILDAVPNRPTIGQRYTEGPSGRRVSATGLSLQSLAIGGAEVRIDITGPQGSASVTEEFYETNLEDVVGVGTWHDARKAFREAADETAKALVALR